MYMVCMLVCLIGAESEFDDSSVSSGTPTSSVSNMGENILPPTPLAPRGEPSRRRPDSAKGKRGRMRKGI